MEFTFNGVIPNDIYFNGNALTRVTCNGVTVWEKVHPSYGPLTMTAHGASTIRLAKSGSAPTVNLKYSLDGGETWVQWDFSEISLTDGQSVCFKGQNTRFATTTGYYNYFVMTGSIAASGNIMSIIDDGACTTTTIPATYCFYDLFHNCTSLTSAPALPATTLQDFCYSSMFFRCSSLTTAPALPATTLTNGCYHSMFWGCTALTTTPALPATTLARGCYYSMFFRCSSLTTAPALPATTLVHTCYYSMFYECTALTSAPTLPATILADGCYQNMFQGCSSLTTAPDLPATTLAGACYSEMFSRCSSLTTAPALPATTLTNGCYSGMFYECTSLTTAPELPATTLTEKCYFWMFIRCTNLNYIKCLATDISATNCTLEWVNSVAASGTFVKAASMTGWTRSTNGIPTGWTVQTA